MLYACKAWSVTHLIFSMQAKDIKRTNGQPELARVSELAYTLSQGDKLFSSYLQQCVQAEYSCLSRSRTIPCQRLPSATHVCCSSHEAFSDIVHPVAVQAQAVWLVGAVYQIFDVFANVLVQLLQYRLGLLRQLTQ